MSFAENLKKIRRDNNLSQEGLAEIMEVSRQSISKYEMGKTYPEIDKLILLSNKFKVSLDDLLDNCKEDGQDASEVVQKNNIKELEANREINKPNNKKSNIDHEKRIYIRSHDGKSLMSYYKFRLAKVFKAKKNQPKYALMGVYKQTFWGEYDNLIAFYQSEEDIKREIHEIQNALDKKESSYDLRYFCRVKNKFLDVLIDE